MEMLHKCINHEYYRKTLFECMENKRKAMPNLPTSYLNEKKQLTINTTRGGKNVIVIIYHVFNVQ